MNNREKYRNSVENIRVDENLKKKVIREAIEKQEKKRKVRFMFKTAMAFAMCAILVIGGVTLINKNLLKDGVIEPVVIAKTDLTVAGLERIQNMEELEKIFEENKNIYYYTNDIILEDAIAIEGTTASKGETTTQQTTNSSNDYSKTNVQHENVDEADIVKTDGKYIYYLNGSSNYYNANKMINIIDVDTRKVITQIELNDKDLKYFYASEMFLTKTKLIVMVTRVNEKEEERQTETVAIVYDITDKENVKKAREISASGDYVDARMIGDNLYFVTNEYKYRYMNEDNPIVLPYYIDTLKSDEQVRVDCTDIYYLKGSNDASFTQVTAVNIEKKILANTQTFLGLGDTIYCSEENMYIVKEKYDSKYSRIFGTYDYKTETEIFKFKLTDNNIEFVAKGIIDGTTLNQFSMDEHKGYLRIATTGYNEKNETTNNVIILDKDLKEVGSVTGLADDERIYSVRFMGDVGYVVTFKQIDPLFVIDLKNPTNPVVKGELKIPGYSSYLHPYDESHVIGIGKDTETNMYGGTEDTGLKISMFDVSDLENPKEVFNTVLGSDYATSEALSEHKAILCNREKEILALPINISEYLNNGKTYYFRGAVIFKIDLENKKFERKALIKENDAKEYSYNIDTRIRRIIYIGDYFYTLSDEKVMIIDMKTYEKVDEIIFENTYEEKTIEEPVIVY